MYFITHSTYLGEVDDWDTETIIGEILINFLFVEYNH